MNGKKERSFAAKTVVSPVIVFAVLLALFLLGRWGWRLGGFDACEGAGIETVEVTDREVRISGFYPGSFPEGFLGYHAEEADGKLYVGFKFSGLFGLFETGDFAVTIPVKGEIKEVIVKTGTNETVIWSDAPELPQAAAQDEMPSPLEAPAVPDAYIPVLDMYFTVLSEGWDAARVMDAGLNCMVADSHHGDPPEEIGYTVADLDGDGTEELAIGSLAEDDFFGKMVFSLYTLNAEGMPVLLFDSTERDRFYYAGGCRFANLGSSDWNESFVTTLKLEDKEMIDMTYTTDPADYVQMELTPFSQWTK